MINANSGENNSGTALPKSSKETSNFSSNMMLNYHQTRVKKSRSKSRERTANKNNNGNAGGISN